MNAKHRTHFQAWINVTDYHRSLPVESGFYFDTVEEAEAAAFDSISQDAKQIIITRDDSTVWSESVNR